MDEPRTRSFCMRTRTPKEPKYPYKKGMELILKSYQPQAPRDVYFGLSEEADWERQTEPPVDRCLRHAPEDGQEKPGQLTFKIEKLLRAEDGVPAQVFAGNILRSDEALKLEQFQQELVVVKLFDALYDNHDQDRYDPMIYADCSFRNETAAYNTLANLQGKCIPKFFGSFNCDMALNHNGSVLTRPVRAVVMQYLSGTRMIDVNYEQFSVDQRKHILKQLVDIESAFFTQNIRHNDVSPRNIILDFEPGNPTTEIKLFFFDFERAIIGRDAYMDPQQEKELLPGVYITPLLRWDWMLLEQLVYEGLDPGWVPWDWDEWIRETYAADHSGVTEKMKALFGPGVLNEDGEEL